MTAIILLVLVILSAIFYLKGKMSAVTEATGESDTKREYKISEETNVITGDKRYFIYRKVLGIRVYEEKYYSPTGMKPRVFSRRVNAEAVIKKLKEDGAWE